MNLPCVAASPEFSGVGSSSPASDISLHQPSRTRSRMQVEAAWRTPSSAAGAVGDVRESQCRHLHFRVCFAAQLAHTASMILVMPPRLTG